MIFQSLNLQRHFTKHTLESLESLIKRLKETNSINLKVEILREHLQLLPLLQKIYDPHYKFHITSRSLKGCVVFDKAHELEELLDALNKRLLTGKSAAMTVQGFVNRHSEHENLIKTIIDKNLKAGIGFEIIKKASGSSVEPASIPVALGFPISACLEYLKKSMASGDLWLKSRKYDGIRAIMIYDPESLDLKVFSRNLVPISNLNPGLLRLLKQSFSSIKTFCVFDGELVYLDSLGQENFSKTVSMVKTKASSDADLRGLHYVVFDLLNLKDQSFTDRQTALKNIQFGETDTVQLVEQIPLIEFELEELLREAEINGYEGFIIRRDCVLKDGRSRDLLKIKPFEDAEFKVIDYDIGPMMTSSSLEEQLLLSITVDFNGGRVKIGSGFTIAQRRMFAKDPSLITGKIITVRYQELSRAQGRERPSLRFPIFKSLHGSERTE